MTDYNFNSLVDRVQVYDTFVQLISGSDKYRFKSLQKWEPIQRWPNLKRVSDDGSFFLNQEVTDSEVDIELVLTADEVDTVDPPTNARTLSYYQYQKNVLRNHVEIAVSTVYYAKDTASNKYLRLNFTLELDSMSTPRINGDGDVAVILHGIIIMQTHAGVDCHPTFIRSSS
jgi:hypothetical protein